MRYVEPRLARSCVANAVAPPVAVKVAFSPAANAPTTSSLACVVAAVVPELRLVPLDWLVAVRSSRPVVARPRHCVATASRIDIASLKVILIVSPPTSAVVTGAETMFVFTELVVLLRCTSTV